MPSLIPLFLCFTNPLSCLVLLKLGFCYILVNIYVDPDLGESVAFRPQHCWLGICGCEAITLSWQWQAGQLLMEYTLCQFTFLIGVPLGVTIDKISPGHP